MFHGNIIISVKRLNSCIMDKKYNLKIKVIIQIFLLDRIYRITMIYMIILLAIFCFALNRADDNLKLT